MSIDKIIVTLFSLGGAAFTFWFFLMKNDKTVEVSDSIDISVDGGFTPNVISIQKGQTTKINFLRKDTNPCLEEVILGDFKVKKYLPLNKQVSVELNPQEKGEFSYACSMGMYHGKIIVK